MTDTWKTLTSKIVYQNPHWKVREDVVQLPNGATGTYFVNEKQPDFVIVIARKDDTFGLVKQYRYPISQWLLQFSMGGLNPNEAPLAAAKRELAEETGLQSPVWRELGFLWLSPGHELQGCTVFEAVDCTESGVMQLDDMEYGMTLEWYTERELQELIANGTFCDCPCLAAWQLLKSKS